MSEPIDFYGVAWPRPEPARDDLSKLRAEMRGVAAEWSGTADADDRMALNPAFTAIQRDRLKASADARRNCAWRLLEAIKGEK